jgi:anti-anti-sigma factor
MSHLECPSCRLRISALGAPLNCPRCRIRSGQRVELVPVSMFVGRSAPQAGSARSVRMLPFRLSVSEPRPGCLEIGVQGELDLAVTDRLTQALGSVAEHREVLLDLAQCDFVDSSAVEAILHAEAALTAEGRRIVVVGAGGQVLRVLTLMGLTERGLVYASGAEAPAGAPAVVAA